MNRYGKRSLDNLSTCDNRLQTVFRVVLDSVDHSVICGHRNEEDQNEAFESKNSKVKWPNSKHNSYPSKAIDVIPYPSGYTSIKRFYYLAGVVDAVSSRMGINVRWGGNWDMDDDLEDNKFMDLGHWELVD